MLSLGFSELFDKIMLRFIKNILGNSRLSEISVLVVDKMWIS